MARLLRHYAVVAGDRVRQLFGPGSVSQSTASDAQRWLRSEMDGALTLAVELAQQDQFDSVAALTRAWSMWLEYSHRMRDAKLLLTLALRNPEPRERRSAALRLARNHTREGNVDEALSWTHHAVFLDPDDPEGLSQLFFALRNAGQLRDAFTHLTRAQHLVAERGDELWAGRVACNLASATFDLGHWAEVARHEQAATHISDRLGDNPCRAYVLQGRLFRAAQLGRWEAFDAVMGALVGFGETTGILPEPSSYRALQARSLIARARNDEASDLLALNRDESPAGLFEVARLRIGIALNAGDPGSAATELKEIDDLGRVLYSPYYLVEAEWLRGAVHLSAREPHLAAEHFEASLRLACDMAMALDIARARFSVALCSDPTRDAAIRNHHVMKATSIMAGSGVDVPGDVRLLERWREARPVRAGGDG
ncbi:MAG: hypothetical protein R2734_06730 [Nocardioides sp.]